MHSGHAISYEMDLKLSQEGFELGGALMRVDVDEEGLSETEVAYDGLPPGRVVDSTGTILQQLQMDRDRGKLADCVMVWSKSQCITKSQDVPRFLFEILVILVVDSVAGILDHLGKN
jgi:hypothetical protein